MGRREEEMVVSGIYWDDVVGKEVNLGEEIEQRGRRGHFFEAVAASGNFRWKMVRSDLLVLLWACVVGVDVTEAALGAGWAHFRVCGLMCD